MTLEADDSPSIGGHLRPSIPIRLIDRFGARRAAVVGWNPDTAGFEAAVAIFDLEPGTFPVLHAGVGQYEFRAVGSPSTPTVPAAVVFGRRPFAEAASPPLGRGGAESPVGPWLSSLCLTVDSLIDGLGFEGFRFDVVDTERLSELADKVERCNGSPLLSGRAWTTVDGPRTLLRLEHPTLPAGLTVFDGRYCHRVDRLEVARRMVELCWTRFWTASERDLTLALTLDALTDAVNGFCFTASDVALWCMTGRPLPNRAGTAVRTGEQPSFGQLQLGM